MHCRHCESTDLIKRGSKGGYQRYMCRDCGRYGTDRAPKFSAETKAMAIQMYMNSMGIRAIGRVLKASPATVLNWIRKEHAALQVQQAGKSPLYTGAPDIIEMDEIYTYIQKNGTGR
jgi:transposase-like protein